MKIFLSITIMLRPMPARIFNSFVGKSNPVELKSANPSFFPKAENTPTASMIFAQCTAIFSTNAHRENKRTNNLAKPIEISNQCIPS